MEHAKAAYFRIYQQGESFMFLIKQFGTAILFPSAQMVQRLFRAAPVAWRNEQNHILRRTSRGDQRFII